ncbi:MAG: AbrB/MazE/SpoVT family DNA-binding domain-containing protein [bacterium]
MEGKISTQRQLTIPKKITQMAGLEPGTAVLLDVVELGNIKKLIITKRPKDWVEEYYGFDKETWEKQDGSDYVKKERQSWES